VAITPAADRIDQLNTIYNPLRFKARANATWSRGGILGAYTSTIWMSMTTTS
jgi:hypothetical protein